MTEQLNDKTEPVISMSMRTPRTLDIEITARCNLRCRYCYFFNNSAVDYRELPADEWLKFFDELNGS
jgi:MoaA/NifB/PqqE/SkfB family radical SAM enzyme